MIEGTRYHECDKMLSNEVLFEYGDGWDFVQSHENQIYGIYYCPKCGAKL